MATLPRVLRAGSSPLTRGKLIRPLVYVGHLGLIPAHAGKTTRTRCRQPRQPAHPRSRGENSETLQALLADAGSSPLTRGKLRRGVAHIMSRRLIPAHAGKTRGPPYHPRRGPAHPRSRGENRDVIGAILGGLGSSPLTRGKQVANGQLARLHRLIPAHAGKTSRSVGVAACLEAHPRSRGENPPPVRIGVAAPGSSPLTRGKPLRW